MEAVLRQANLLRLWRTKKIQPCAQDNYFIPNCSSYGKEAGFQFAIPLQTASVVQREQ